MRIIIIGLLTIVFLYYLIWYPLRNDNSKNWFMVILSIIIIIPLTLFEFRWLYLENEGTKVTIAISGVDDSHLHCQRLSEGFVDASANLGEVSSLNPKEALIKHTTCTKLFNYIEGNKSDPPLEQIIAVAVLTHESIHVSGDFNESSTECKSIQKVSQTAQMLGATKKQGDSLALKYYKEVYPNLRTNYISLDCYENGPQDLTPNDNLFP